MKRRLAAMLLCALLVFQMAAVPADAAAYVHFVAAEENIVPMSDKTMPFWQGEYLYISSSIFKDTVKKSLNVGVVQSKAKKLTVLYSVGQDWPLTFDWGNNRVYDKVGNTYSPGAVQRNGEIFVPASLVASFFGLEYSVTKVNRWADGQQIQGDLIWLRQPDFGLPDRIFVDAASASIDNCYLSYLKEKEAVQTVVTPVTPPASGGVEIEGKKIYLCMTANENTVNLLNTLDRYGMQATFFCTPEFLGENGDLLRRMTATGHGIGILADGADPERTVARQLEEGNDALYRATFGRTRLVRLQNGDQTMLREAEAAGYRCLDADLNRAGYALRSADNAASLLNRISSRRDDVSVWLADTVGAVGLRAFLTAAQREDARCLVWTETA